MHQREIDLESPFEQHDNKYQRISESYPPSTMNNFHYIADVHSALQGIDINEIDQEKEIISRHITSKQDVEQLKALHSEWFPIQYDQIFFDTLISSKSMNLILELDLARFGKGKYIIAAIIYVKKDTKFREMKFSFTDLCKDSYCYYIQTIGVINEFRKCGFASYLLDYVKQEAIKNQKIKYISLHMVVYNHSGERFYLKNGFKIIDKLKEFYFIEQKEYDSFLFCYYTNECQPPVSFLQYVQSVFSQISNKFKSTPSRNKYTNDQEIKII